MKEVRSRWRSMTGVVGYLWPFEHETNKQKRKSACWFYTKDISLRWEHTCTDFLHRDKLCCWWAKLLHEEMSPPPTSCTSHHLFSLRLHVCAHLRWRKGLSCVGEKHFCSSLLWSRWRRDQLCEFAVKFTLMVRAVHCHIWPFGSVDRS